jgi:teichuronic acid biosynthesis glycosyltransferase TuaC
MRVCMVSPHLPPDQSANALLPVMLGETLASRGVVTSYVSHPPVTGSPHTGPSVTFVPKRARDRFSRSLAGAIVAGTRMAMGASRSVRASDLVHLHSGGFIIEIGAWLARRHRKPYVITLYGTDISAYDPRRNARFGGVVRDAACRVFYSRGLLEQARSAGLAPDPSTVIYAPVASGFTPVDERERLRMREELNVGDGPLLLTVKRLHPVAGHQTLLDALPAVVRAMPSVQLWLAGEGESKPALERRIRELGLERHVRFLGRQNNASLRRYYAAADLFVLPSHVESWGTVMLEALACGTPVVASDTVGGAEVRETFPDSVRVVRKDAPDELSAAILEELKHGRRASAGTIHHIQTSFSVEACAAQYLEVYRSSV